MSRSHVQIESEDAWSTDRFAYRICKWAKNKGLYLCSVSKTSWCNFFQHVQTCKMYARRRTRAYHWTTMFRTTIYIYTPLTCFIEAFFHTFRFVIDMSKIFNSTKTRELHLVLLNIFKVMYTHVLFQNNKKSNINLYY